MMSIHRTTALCLNPSLNKFKVFISVYSGRIRLQYASRVYETSSSRLVYGGFIRRILEQVKSALSFTDNSPTLDIPFLSPIRGSSSSIVDTLKCKTQKYSLTVSNVKGTFHNRVYILKKTVAKPRNVFPFSTIEYKSPNEESSTNVNVHFLSKPDVLNSSDDSDFSDMIKCGINESHLNPSKIFNDSFFPTWPNTLSRRKVSLSSDHRNNSESKTTLSSRDINKLEHTRGTSYLKYISSENVNNNPDLRPSINIKESNKYIDLHSFSQKWPKRDKDISRDNNLASEHNKVSDSAIKEHSSVDFSKNKSSDLNCRSVQLFENKDQQRNSHCFRNMMILNPNIPRLRTIFYFHNKSAHVIKPSKFHDLNPIVEYISQLNESNLSNKPARINFIEFHKFPEMNSLSTNYPKLESSGETTHNNESNSVIYKKQTSISFENTNNKFWIPNKNDELSQDSDANEFMSAVGISDKIHNKDISKTQSHEGSFNKCLFLDSNDKLDTDISKIPIKKDKLIEETVVPNKSILNIINSIDKSAVIIQKDLYITDRIIQKINSDDKHKDDKKKLETSGSLEGNCGEQILYMEIPSTEKNGMVKLSLSDFANDTCDLKKKINSENVNISKEKIDNLEEKNDKELVLLENCENGEILLLKPNFMSQEGGLVSFSFVGNGRYKGISTTDLIKKAAALLEKEKYSQKKQSEGKDDHEKGIKKILKKNEKPLPKPNPPKFHSASNNLSDEDRNSFCFANISNTNSLNLPIKKDDKLNCIYDMRDSREPNIVEEGDGNNKCYTNYIKKEISANNGQFFGVKPTPRKSENTMTFLVEGNSSCKRIGMNESELTSDKIPKFIVHGEKPQVSMVNPQLSYKSSANENADFEGSKKENVLPKEDNLGCLENDQQKIKDLSSILPPVNHENSNNTHYSKDKQFTTPQNNISNISIVECPTLIDSTVECLMNSKGKHDSHNKTGTNPKNQTINLQRASIKKRSPTMKHITKTSINSVKRNNMTDINVTEKETVIDSRVPIPFSTETFFQIVGTSSRLQNVAKVVDSAKNQLMSSTIDSKTPTSNDILTKLDEILQVIRSSPKPKSPQFPSIPSKNQRGNQMIARRVLKPGPSRKVEAKTYGRKNRIRKPSVEIVSAKERININKKEGSSGKLSKPSEIKVPVAEKNEIIGEGIKSSVKSFSKVQDVKNVNRKLEPKTSDNEAKSDKRKNKSNNSENQSVNNYVHLLKMSNKKDKLSKSKKKRVGFFGHKSLSKRDKKILKEILKGAPKKNKFTRARRTKDIPTNSMMVKKYSASSGEGDSKQPKTPVKDHSSEMKNRFEISKRENISMKETKNEETKLISAQKKTVTPQPLGDVKIKITKNEVIDTQTAPISFLKDTPKISQNKNIKDAIISANQNKPSSSRKKRTEEENKVSVNEETLHKTAMSTPTIGLSSPQKKVYTTKETVNSPNKAENANAKNVMNKSKGNLIASNEKNISGNPSSALSDRNQTEKEASKSEVNGVSISEQTNSKNVTSLFSEKTVSTPKNGIHMPNKIVSTPKKGTSKKLSKKRMETSTVKDIMDNKRKKDSSKMSIDSQTITNKQFPTASNKNDRNFKEFKDEKYNDANASTISPSKSAHGVKIGGNKQHNIIVGKSNPRIQVSKINPTLRAGNSGSKRIVDETKIEKPIRNLDLSETKKNNIGSKKQTQKQLPSEKKDISGQSAKESPSFQIYVAAKTFNDSKSQTTDNPSNSPSNTTITKDKQIPSGDKYSVNRKVFKKIPENRNNEENFYKTNVTIIENKNTSNKDSTQHQEKFQTDLINNVKKKIELQHPINFRVRPVKVTLSQDEFQKLTTSPSRKVTLKSQDQKIVSQNSKRLTKEKRKKSVLSPSHPTSKKSSKQKATFARPRIPKKNKLSQEAYQDIYSKTAKERITLEGHPKKDEKIESTKFDGGIPKSSSLIKEKQFNTLTESTLDKIKNEQEGKLINQNSVQNFIGGAKEGKENNKQTDLTELSKLKTEERRGDISIKKEEINEEPKSKSSGEIKQVQQNVQDIKENKEHIQNKKIDSKLDQEVKDKNTNFSAPQIDKASEAMVQNKAPKHEKEPISFPMLLVDLDKMTKEIKPVVSIKNCHKCSVPLNQIKEYPLSNPKKAGGFACPKSILNICPSKDPMLRKELSFLPSVTRILNLTLPKMSRNILREWRRKMIREIGENGFKAFYKGQMTRGTQFHNLIQDHLVWGRRRETPATLSFQSIQLFLSDLTDLAAINSHVVHKTLGYRGVVDCIAKYKDKPVVVEWKRLDEREKLSPSSLENSFLQMSAYLGALNVDENYKFQMKGGIIVVAYSDGNQADIYEVNPQDCEKYWKLWLNRLQQYHRFAQNIN